MLETQDWRRISLLVFGLRTRAPDPRYYDHVREYILHHGSLVHLVSVVRTFPIILSDLTKEYSDAGFLHQMTKDTKILLDWISGLPSDITLATSGTVLLPLLTLVQVTQYFTLLQHYGVNHETLVVHLQRAAGVQGYCAGLPCAMAVAASRSPVDLAHNITVALRLAFVIGLMGDIGNSTHSKVSMMVIRLKSTSQSYNLLKEFPQVVVAAVTDPKTITVSGSTETLAELALHATAEGLSTQHWPLDGKWHHSDNLDATRHLKAWCTDRKEFQFVGDNTSLTSLRSNQTGGRLRTREYVDDAICAILTAKSQWNLVMANCARDLKDLSRPLHTIVNLGIGDSIPLQAFQEQGLRVSKVDGHELFCQISQTRDLPLPNITSTYPEHTVAIIGASCRLPGANNLDELWSILSQGKDQHHQLDGSRFDLYDTYRASQTDGALRDRKFYANLLNDVKSFDHKFFSINPREAASTDPQQRLLLELAYEAMESSGYLRSHQRENGDRVACYIGAGAVDYNDNTNSHAPTAYTATGTIRSFLSGKISHHFGWTGPSEVIDTACSSSLAAIVRACQTLQARDCTMAIAGGVHVMTSPHNFFDLGRAGFLSPTGQCKPFDASADGYCRSEGAGLVVLKLLSQAQLDSDPILGLIPGAATNQGGLSASITVPHLPAQTQLYQSVLSKAGMDAHDISYVEAHGTGTQVGDPIEMESIRQVFGMPDRSDTLYIGSVKGNIGHCEFAAGVAGLLKVVAMLLHKQIPPQANFTTLNPKIPSLRPDNMNITTIQKSWQSPRRAAIVNGYGAAGSNSALLVCTPPTTTEGNETFPCERGFAQPIILSAATKTSLDAHMDILSSFLAESKESSHIRKVAFTINSCRKRHKIIALMNVPHSAAFSENLDARKLEYHEIEPHKNRTVLAFSGQGKSYIGLNKQIYERYERLRQHIDECDTILVDLGYSSILPFLFQTEPVDDPIVLQCGHVASQIAFAYCWLDVGLKVDVVIGHSLGELAALAISGVLSLRDCLKLVAGRAKLIASKWGAEKGAMLVVAKPRHEVERMIDDIRLRTSGELQLEIACYNARSNHVVVGSHAAIDEIERRSRAGPNSRQAVTRRLHTDYGFHSTMTTPILEELDQLSDSLQWNQPTIPLEQCKETEGDTILPYSPSRHARQPVHFANAVQRIEKRLGSCSWIEAGFNTSIIPMVERTTIQDKTHAFFPVTARDGEAAKEVISNITMKMWRLGMNVDSWVALEGHVNQIWLPPYQFDKTVHWLENIDRAAEAVALRNLQSESTPKLEATPPQMVVVKSQPEHGSFPAQFTIDTSCDRFSSIMEGHRICQQSISPATLYLECVAMALSLVDYLDPAQDLHFEKVIYHAPVSLATKRLLLDIQYSGVPSRLNFQFKSSSSSDVGVPVTTCVTGDVLQGRDGQYDMLQRLFETDRKRLESGTDHETLFCGRAYQLFNPVVSYGPFFRGMQKVSLGAREASADVLPPDNQPGLLNSHIRHLCDAVTLDMFVQVLGLLVNSSDLASEGYVLVGAGIESLSVSHDCRLDQKTLWKVYTKFTPLNLTKAIGDVLIYSTEGRLVGMINGCTFSKVAVSTLERLLGSSETQSNKSVPRAVSGTPARSLVNSDVSSEAPILTPAETTVSSDARLEITSQLQQLVAMYTGLASTDIPEYATLGDLGVDSLAAQGLCGDLEASFGIVVSPIALHDESLKTLLNHRHVISLQESRSTTTPNSISKVTVSTVTSSGTLQTEQSRLELLYATLHEYSGDPPTMRLNESMALAEIGIDSLASLELRHDLLNKLSVDFNIDPFTTVGDLVSALAGPEPQSRLEHVQEVTVIHEYQKNTLRLNVQTDLNSVLPSPRARRIFRPDVVHILRDVDASFENVARCHGLLNYWTDVAPQQDELLVAYISEAFAQLGTDLKHYAQGQVLPAVPYEAKHAKLVHRFWAILQEHGLVAKQGGIIVRGDRDVSVARSSQIHQDFVRRHPQYACEAELMATTGMKLADCLSGRISAMDLLFSYPKAWNTMETFYHSTPLLATMTEQLVSLVMKVANELNPTRTDPLRILEVGAGMGGTTERLARALNDMSIPVQYTFSDMSHTLLSKAKEKFTEYTWMGFEVFNLEKSAPEAFCGTFDIVIGTNSVHATTDRAAVMARLNETIRDGGFALLSETTRIINWCDLVFGLLDGWWLAEHGSAYPFQPAEVWMDYFRKAGFKSFAHSQGVSKEASTQQLLVACKDEVEFDDRPNVSLTSNISYGGRWNLKTMTYKTVDGMEIDADLYLPSVPPKAAMSVALMIHGGGYIYFSKRNIRRQQITYLLSQNILPISINYRLCPETNILDGAITDVRDAYVWIQSKLPSLLLQQHPSTTIDPTKIAVIGYSAGGHLAMTLAWTSKDVCLTPPRAILSFYAPSIFSSTSSSSSSSTQKLRSQSDLPRRTLSWDQILRSLPSQAITGYEPRDPVQEWLCSNDARAEMIRSFFHENTELPLMLNVIPCGDRFVESGLTAEELLTSPSSERIDSICPLAQLEDQEQNEVGWKWKTPTYIIHGDQDDVAPFEDAVRLFEKLRKCGVKCGMSALEGVGHIFDTGVAVGSKEWVEWIEPGLRFVCHELES